MKKKEKLLRIPINQYEKLVKISQKLGISINEFILIAIAERIKSFALLDTDG
ncbi:hypothetical protein [Gemella sp. ND 6198]|uniref:hypothetical protein n=1 Tax=Gemella sp. ND 6198 TaxID=2040624 RepID=UPI0013B45C72|nr:hypothetical protein [Gemella sp. ND 6198]